MISNRSRFGRRLIAVFAVMFAFPAASEPLTSGAPTAEKLGWRLGVQAFSFYKISFYETVDHLERIGVRYVEAFPNQTLKPGNPNVKFDHNLSPELRAEATAKLDDAGITLVNYGVVPLPNDEAACRKVFDFAKAMNIETIVSEPPDDAFDLIDRLAQEYEVDVAIHNHPSPNENWNPEKVLAECEGRSPRIGACVDTSHWRRSGVDVLEGLKLLEGRIKSFHFGDVDPERREEFIARTNHPPEGEPPPTMVQKIFGVPNVVYGQGDGDMMAWLREVKRQNIRALFCIEAFFERPPNEAVNMAVESVKWFESAAQQLIEE